MNGTWGGGLSAGAPAPRRSVRGRPLGLCLLALCLLATPTQAQTAVGISSRPTGLPSQVSPDVKDLPGLPAQPLSVPVLVQEALAAGMTGVTRTQQVVTFGLPFSPDMQVGVSSGRPALSVLGSERWQFRSLQRDSDGWIRWALCDAVVDLAAGATGQLVVERGAGKSPWPDLAQELSLLGTPQVVIDTGRVRAVVPTSGAALFNSIRVDGVELLNPATGPARLTGTSVSGQGLRMSSKSSVWVEENGPARALVRIDGTLEDLSGQALIDVTVRIEAFADSPELVLTTTLRNANSKRWSHALLQSVELVLPVDVGANLSATSAHHQAPVSLLLGPAEELLLHVAQTSATVAGVNSPLYFPHLPKQPGTPGKLVQQGYRLATATQELHPLGNPDQYPKLGWMHLAGAKGGVVAALERMAVTYPTALTARGSGRLVLGFFPAQNPAPYTFIFGQHESRRCVLSFHAGTLTSDPALVAARLDVPIAARASDYLHYDAAQVFPYQLVNEDQHELAYMLLGINHKLDLPNEKFFATHYLYKGTTGPQNNHDRIERLLASEWLRSGRGGQYLLGLDLARYKAEWQVRRSDDFVWTAGLPEPSNDSVPHTTGTFGDDEHRYRAGMVLAYYLTGDRRLSEALSDELEVLKTVSLWPHERSMYMTLRALAALYRFSDDPQLLELLRERLAYTTTPTLDVKIATSGFGWEGPPGQGSRRYFAFSGDLASEKPPGEHFQARGWISGSLGPIAYHEAAAALPPGDPLAAMAATRAEDLAFWTRNELFPYEPDPLQRRLVYSYALSLIQVVQWEQFDFHPVLFGQGRAWAQTGDIQYLKRAAEQIQAFSVHDSGPSTNNLFLLDSRLDCQDFFAQVLKATLP